MYIESGEWPLHIRILKQQINFWQSVQTMISNYPDHFIARLINTTRNYPYIKYYEDLITKYQTVNGCELALKNDYRTKYEDAIRKDAANDIDSRLRYILDD